MPLNRTQAWKIARAVPGARERLWFRQPALFVNDQFLTKVHHVEDAMVLKVGSLEMREMMLGAEPALFYITDHYRNFPFVLMHLSALDARTLKQMLEARAAQLAATKPVKRPTKKKVVKKIAAKKKQPGKRVAKAKPA